MRDRRAGAAGLAIVPLLGLCACASLRGVVADPVSVAQVVTGIKTDIGVYQAMAERQMGEGPLPDTCRGDVVFTIQSVKVSLLTTSDETIAGSASGAGPVGGGVVVGGNLGGSAEVKGAQTLTFTLYPLKTGRGGPAEPPSPIDRAVYPITTSLLDLRAGLLAASARPPCVSLIPPAPDPKGAPRAKDPAADAPKDEGGSYTFGFTALKTATGGASVKFLVFSLGATRTAQASSGNTIVVTFKAVPGHGFGFH